jgi:hypothetical protein
MPQHAAGVITYHIMPINSTLTSAAGMHHQIATQDPYIHFY